MTSCSSSLVMLARVCVSLSEGPPAAAAPVVAKGRSHRPRGCRRAGEPHAAGPRWRLAAALLRGPMTSAPSSSSPRVSGVCSRAALPARVREVDPQGPPPDLVSVQVAHRALGRDGVVELAEPVALGLARVAVGHEAQRLDWPDLREEICELLLRHLIRDVPDEAGGSVVAAHGCLQAPSWAAPGRLLPAFVLMLFATAATQTR